MKRSIIGNNNTLSILPSSKLTPTQCNCTHKLRLIAWNSNYARIINELTDRSIVNSLKQIDKFIRFDAFTCRNRDNELIAAQSLLTLWAKLLNLLLKWWQ